MSNESYGTPLVISPDRVTHCLQRVRLADAGTKGGYDENFIQELTFQYPNCLPIDQIDPAYSDPVPICMELNTPAGPIDGLFVTPSGRLVVLEAKLWRNPEARRKVVAQILDYAKELSAWDYEDLQREVSRRLDKKGNSLFHLVQQHHPNLDESRFVDEVHMSLKRGRFLLLIVGDGIREGAGAIANFLESVGSLEFTFGLVELAIFEHPLVGRVIQPRVLANTTEIRRVIVQIPEHAVLVEEGSPASENVKGNDQTKYFVGFWTELLEELELDDTSQQLANVWRGPNIAFPMPPSGDVCWIGVYFAQSSNEVGVYIRFSKPAGVRAYEVLAESREEIDKDLGMESNYGIPPSWRYVSESLRSIGVSLGINDPLAPGNREAIKDFFKDVINRFVNTFRHRMERIVRESQTSD